MTLGLPTPHGAEEDPNLTHAPNSASWIELMRMRATHVAIFGKLQGCNMTAVVQASELELPRKKKRRSEG